MRRTIESLIPPENKQVLWLDVSGPIKQLKYYANGEWVIVGDDTLNNEEIVTRVLEKVDSDFQSYIKKEDADNTYVAKEDMSSYQNKLIVGNHGEATENAAAGNEDVWLIEVNEAEGISSAHNVVGKGATTVTSDAEGKISITSTDVYPTKLVIDQSTDTSNVPINLELSNGNKVTATLGATTQVHAGVMTSAEKAKLSTIAEAATADTALTSTEVENLLH